MPISQRRSACPPISSYGICWRCGNCGACSSAMQHPDVVELIELLLGSFPQTQCYQTRLFKSQPGTVVKEVLRVLLGLPLPHDYALLETANTFYPRVDANGTVYPFRLPFGFTTAMSDQIPFERAYELWQDTIFLRHYDPRFPDNPERWRRYTRDEIYEGLKHATHPSPCLTTCGAPPA